MSLTATLRTAASGLQAAQASLRAVSDNIANVNTPGYARKAVNQESLVVDGAGMGVRIDGVTRITDQYLQLASLSASSDAERWSAVAEYLDNAQSLFGNPGNDGSGLICVNSRCVPGCLSNAQCPGVKTCQSGQCR